MEKVDATKKVEWIEIDIKENDICTCVLCELTKSYSEIFKTNRNHFTDGSVMS